MSKHLKRLKAPRTLKLHRKEKKWTIKAMPGPHKIRQSNTSWSNCQGLPSSMRHL